MLDQKQLRTLADQVAQGQGEGREKMMLAILAESALRSLLLGGVVWIGLNLLRVRNPHVHMTSWVIVLVASLAMPLLMHWTTVTITPTPLPVPAPENLWPADHGRCRSRCARRCRSDPGVPVAAPGAAHAAVNWLARRDGGLCRSLPACCCCGWRSAST